MNNIPDDLKNVPGIKFVDHIAISVKQGELDAQVKAYELMGFRELHREEVHGTYMVREALLKIGDGMQPDADMGPIYSSRSRWIHRCRRRSRETAAVAALRILDFASVARSRPSMH